jgi:UDP-N-acetylmuramoyl-tripeptide--D-alanyl-D-alanine ligase
VAHVVGFGENARAFLLVAATFTATVDDNRRDRGLDVSAKISARPPYRAKMLAVLGAAYLAGADLEKVTPALANFRRAGAASDTRCRIPKA